MSSFRFLFTTGVILIPQFRARAVIVMVIVEMMLVVMVVMGVMMVMITVVPDNSDDNVKGRWCEGMMV